MLVAVPQALVALQMSGWQVESMQHGEVGWPAQGGWQAVQGQQARRAAQPHRPLIPDPCTCSMAAKRSSRKGAAGQVGWCATASRSFTSDSSSARKSKSLSALVVRAAGSLWGAERKKEDAVGVG